MNGMIIENIQKEKLLLNGKKQYTIYRINLMLLLKKILIRACFFVTIKLPFWLI